VRKQLNENPMVQLAVIGIAGIAFAFILFTMVLGGGGDEAATDAAADPAATATTVPAADPSAAAPAPGTEAPTATPAPATGTDPAAAGEVPVPQSTPLPPGASSGGSGGADGLLPTKGLPKDVLVAYAKNDAIALVVVDPKGISDKSLESYTKRLAKRDDVEVFVVKAKDIADYARITQGVNVSRVPALIVVRPRNLNDDVPVASVSYGFRSPRSVSQALDDQLYDGGAATSYP
jgi:hypothetical protein